MRKNFEKQWLEKYEKAAKEKKTEHEILFSSAASAMYYPKYFFEYFRPYIKKENRDTRILDVGCGTGIFSKLLADSGFSVVGVDYSAEILKIAKEKAGGRKIEFTTADIYSLPFADKSFDIVVCFGVFQCLEEPSRAMKEIKRVLKKEGKFFLITLNSMSVDSFFQKSEARRYNPQKLKKEASEKGFCNIKLKGVYFFPGFASFLTAGIINLKIYKILNLFFPIFCFFSHAFYLEAKSCE